LTTAARSTVPLRAGFVDRHRTSVQFTAAQGVNGTLTFGVAAHLDKSEPFRLARIPIGYDADAINGSVLLKQRSDRILGSAEAEISYKYVLHFWFPFEFAAQRIGAGSDKGGRTGQCEKMPKSAGLFNYTSIIT
jgi:hypothetical protein